MDNTSSKTILLLEDDVALNRAVMFKIKKKGHNIISTLQAEEALELLSRDHPHVDIIWLDLLLPKMNGIQFLAELRKNSEYKDTKVVVCSVSEGIEDEMQKRDRSLNLGVVDYLVKSDYELDALTDKVLAYA